MQLINEQCIKSQLRSLRLFGEFIQLMDWKPVLDRCVHISSFGIWWGDKIILKVEVAFVSEGFSIYWDEIEEHRHSFGK